MSFKLAPYLADSVGGIGVLGAMIGGTTVIAKNIYLLQENLVTDTDALVDTINETVKAGFITGFSAAATVAVGGGLALSIGTAVTVSIAAKYL